MSRSYKIIIASLVVIILALLVYAIWFRNSGTPVTPPEQTPVTGMLPLPVENTTSTEVLSPGTGGATNAVEQKFVKLSDKPVFDYWVNTGTLEAYYLTADGVVYLAKEADDTEVSSQPLTALNSLEPNSKGDRALVAFGNPRSLQWGVFDAVDKIWRPLPSGIITATWGAKDNEIIAITGTSGDARTLGTYDVSKTPPAFKAILQDFRLGDVRLTLVPPTSLYITELPSPSYQSRAWLFDTKTLAVNTLQRGGNDLVLRMSQDRTKTFLGSASQFQIFTGLMLTSIFPTPFKTVPQKCASLGSTIACFVPQNAESVPQDSDLIDAYLTNKTYFNDALYLMNTAADSMQQISVSDLNNSKPVDAKNPRITGNYLYFINKLDNGLYRLTTGQ
ncbi:MAG: hypothetical protein Q7R98_01555 [Candidatus Jorgensenbacteria bacterium]|nr:hypothetical protein [Candidatus Jorgensenbacteria bacterium]